MEELVNLFLLGLLGRALFWRQLRPLVFVIIVPAVGLHEIGRILIGVRKLRAGANWRFWSQHAANIFDAWVLINNFGRALARTKQLLP